MRWCLTLALRPTDAFRIYIVCRLFFGMFLVASLIHGYRALVEVDTMLQKLPTV